MSEPYSRTGHTDMRRCKLCAVLVVHEDLIGLYGGPDLWMPEHHEAPCGAVCFGGDLTLCADVVEARELHGAAYPCPKCDWNPPEPEPAVEPAEDDAFVRQLDRELPEAPDQFDVQIEAIRARTRADRSRVDMLLREAADITHGVKRLDAMCTELTYEQEYAAGARSRMEKPSGWSYPTGDGGSQGARMVGRVGQAQVGLRGPTDPGWRDEIEAGLRHSEQALLMVARGLVTRSERNAHAARRPPARPNRRPFGHRGPVLCSVSHCAEPATCIGRYGGGAMRWKCDAHCGHDNTEQTCEGLAKLDESKPAPTARRSVVAEGSVHTLIGIERFEDYLTKLRLEGRKGLVLERLYWCTVGRFRNGVELEARALHVIDELIAAEAVAGAPKGVAGAPKRVEDMSTEELWASFKRLTAELARQGTNEWQAVAVGAAEFPEVSVDAQTGDVPPSTFVGLGEACESCNRVVARDTMSRSSDDVLLCGPCFDDLPMRSCRACKCTDADCSGCIVRTGEACSWVEADLCSACFGDAYPGVSNAVSWGEE